ncbi:unnamed protein product, partial [Durusdinium trenchii]
DYYGAACCIYEMVEKNVMNEAADPSLRPPGRPNLESVKWRHHQGVLKKTLDKFIDIDNPKAVPQMASNIIKDLLNAVESKEADGRAERIYQLARKRGEETPELRTLVA